VAAANVLLKEEEAEGERLRREYLRSVLAAQEDERRRVARELHDTVAQDLAALRLTLERLSAPGRASTQELQALEGRAREMLDTVRRITLDLRPAVLDAMGFLPALQWQFERVQRDNGLKGAFTLDGEPRELDPQLSLRLFRIFQECLQNVALHAQAEHVFVTVAFEADRVVLVTEDDGTGFDLARARRAPDENGRGLGLLGMQERAKILGGSVVLDTAPGEGTTVRVEVPVKPARPAEASS
jgi:two-component system sensor histidine kinase UhpB